MAGVFKYTALDTWLTRVIVDAVGGVVHVPVLFVGGLARVCFPVGLVLRWQAAAPLITVALAPVAVKAGINPWVVALTAPLLALCASAPFWRAMGLL